MCLTRDAIARFPINLIYERAYFRLNGWSFHLNLDCDELSVDV